MKDSLLLLMTPSMSLEKWDARGQLSRELNYYGELSNRTGLKLIIFSYGRKDLKFAPPGASVLIMPTWVPRKLPFKVQNLIYIVCSLFIYRSSFKRAVICKTNQFTASNLGLILKIVYRIPLVIRMGFYYSHFQKISTIRKVKEMLMFRTADLILTTSSEATEFIVNTYNITSSKILTICNSINLDRFKPEKTEKKWDLIFVGKLEKQKNIDLVSKVIKNINGKVLIIGNGSLDYFIKDAMVANPSITWKSRVDNIDLPTYYNQSKCFMLVSDHEGNPKVLLEAMACGLPCVVSNVPGIRECITHDYNGVVVPLNATEIAKSVQNLITDQDKMEKVGKNAVQWVGEHCDYSYNIDSEINFYKKVYNFKIQSNLHLSERKL